jgi:hypothetical protein
MRIKGPREFWAGLMFIGFGLGFAIVGQNYQMGTAVRMGPAYFPTILGGLLAVLGVAILIDGLVEEGEKVPKFYFKPLILLLLGIVLFGILLKPLGLVICSAILIGIGALGGFDFRWKEVVILYVVLAIFSVFVFVKALGLPIPVWPGE